MESGFERKQKHFKVNSPIPNLAITGTLQAKLTFRFKSQAQELLIFRNKDTFKFMKYQKQRARANYHEDICKFSFT